MAEKKGKKQKHTYFGDDEMDKDEKPEVPKRADMSRSDGDGEVRLEKGYFADARYKSWRLIIRNLPFKTKKEDLETICSDIGPFTEIVLPECKDKRFPNSCAGFAFLQFRKRQDAVKAIEKLNMSEVHGRKVAVDWAVPKDTYETAVHEEKQKSRKIKEEIKQEVESVDGDEAVNGDVSIKEETNSESPEEEDEEDDDEDDERSDEVEDKPKNDLKREFKEDRAVLEGRVVFIRNLSYETTDEAVKSALSKFGNVLLAIICRYAGSDHSKGTAFVHFETAEQADECISAIEQAPGVLIDGRRIFGHRALPRSEAATIEKEKLEKKPKDKRNLHLLRAGFIRPGTASAAGMSETDADKRARLAVAAREKLKNLHMFVSPTRLVVHNLPKSMTDKAFRSMCFIAAGNPDGKITECRVWRDRDRINSSGEAVSRGFGFVNFSEHQDALAAMKHLNNNPEIFTNEKRPIVEFSIENLAALRLRESRLKKSQQKQSDIVKDASNRSKRDLEETKKHLSAGGRKPLPSRLGPKIRQRHMNKANIKKKTPAKGLGAKKRKHAASTSETVPKKKKISRSKQLTKYLTLSG